MGKRSKILIALSVLGLGSLGLYYMLNTPRPKNTPQETNSSVANSVDSPRTIQEQSDLIIVHDFDKTAIEGIINNTGTISDHDFSTQQMSLNCVLPDKNLDKILSQGDGVGLIVSSNGYFITCEHTISNFVDCERSIYTIFSRNKIFRGKVIAYSRSKDYALLQAVAIDDDPPVEKQLTGFKPVKISDQTRNLFCVVKRLKYVDPNFHEESKAEHIDLLPRRNILLDNSIGVKKAYPFVSDAITHGDSGTPLYDSSGAVFGLMISVGLDDHNKNLAYVSPLKEFLEELINK